LRGLPQQSRPNGDRVGAVVELYGKCLHAGAPATAV
jgi:hypothetical protein